MNMRRGIHRIVLLISVGIAVVVLYDLIKAYCSEYNFFSQLETGDSLLQDIPEEVFGKNCSLGWILAKNLSLSVLYAALTFIGTYLLLRAFTEGIQWVIQWVYCGFKANT